MDPDRARSTLRAAPDEEHPRVTCAACDAPVNSTDRFCMQCGASVTPATAGEEGPDQEASDDAPDGGPGESGPGESGDETPDDEAMTDALSIPAADATTRLGVELVACPSCGASNAARRPRCGRCDGRLRPAQDTPPPGAAAPVSVPPPDLVSEPLREPEPSLTATAPGGRPGRFRRSTVALVVVGGVLLGGGMGLAAGLGVGPFGEDGSVTFDPRAYLDESENLPQGNTVASATRPDEGELTWAPARTADDDPTTAWQAPAVDGSVELQTRFLTPSWVRRIEIVNGDQASSESFAGTARVRHARVAIGHDLVVDLTLLDQAGTQLVRLSEPVLADEITWTIDGWYGDPPLAVSEIRYVGWVADEDDQEAFRQR